VGQWLVRHLEQHEDEVWRLNGRGGAEARSEGLDVRDLSAVRAFAAKANPEVVYHLAAVAYGPDARRDIDMAVRVTVGGTENLLDACARLAHPPLVVIVSSAEVYGPSPERDLVETDAVRPLNPYGATKLAQEQVGLAYHLAGALEVAIVRAFNHIGPGQRAEFVVPAFAIQLANIAAGERPSRLEVGNLDAVRDFTDVRDVVAAYRLIAQKRCTGQPLNVASGHGLRIRDLLERLIELSGLDVEVVLDAARLRSNDTPSVVGDARELRRLTGWRPQISLEQTLRDVWDDAQRRIVGDRNTAGTT
jgi:GDP-4-dehydro-6-deoxy-D-mannose reductase